MKNLKKVIEVLRDNEVELYENIRDDEFDENEPSDEDWDGKIEMIKDDFNNCETLEQLLELLDELGHDERESLETIIQVMDNLLG